MWPTIFTLRLNLALYSRTSDRVSYSWKGRSIQKKGATKHAERYPKHIKEFVK